MMKFILLVFSFLLIFDCSFAKEDKDKKDSMQTETFSGLKMRLIGPAVASGRIGDFAINPDNHDEWYVAVSSGGVWKTTNHGSTFTPIFDDQGSYSIGCVTMDPNNPHVIWVGSGENNSQRSVSYGDGVYKSTDGGKSWNNMGLKRSEHIAKVIVDPRNSNVVYVAAQGPLWGPGGDRGLYKSTDGGKTWEKSLEISENTGVTDLVMDPRNPDVMYAAAYQRRRHVFTLINGGPESAIYKTTDAGKSWDKLASGLPTGYVGRIGLAIAQTNPDILYALIEATEENGGFFRSTNRGGSWTKMNPYKSSSAQYYQEIFVDPVNPDKVFSVETRTKYTVDGGKTWVQLGLKERHVDDHALWIDPNNTDHLIIGGDGGIYETYDMGENWKFYENLPVTQFYRVSADNDSPFYSVYGGTQDNNTLGTKVRTLSSAGISNDDWIFTVGGDGFKTVIDPTDPDIIYSQPQYGWLVRYDRKSGEITGIQPQPEKGEELRWNWDSPVIISPYDHKTLYFAANKLFKSTDRGNSWKKISGDLTRQIDRNQLPVMGKIWDPEAVAKNASTSLYGNIIALSESPVKQGLIYVGTDDGLIQVTENDGASWTKISTFSAVPETTYVTDVEASLHDENVVFATFDNHKRDDFKPYILKSNDKGKSWVSISSNLPENSPVHTIVQDHVNPDLLFIGTEFGLWFTGDGGKKWVRLKGGLPTIAIKDIDVQRRENDLALASFGRGIYILDDYSPLRTTDSKLLESKAEIFPVKDALMYLERSDKGRNSLGTTYYRGENHPFGAIITYYVKEKPETLKEKRKKSEKESEEKKQAYAYPSFEELRLEDLEESPYLAFIIKDQNGNFIRRLTAPYKAGIERVVWDLRFPDASPLTKETKINKHSGMPVLPGTYTVEMYEAIDGKFNLLAGPSDIVVKPLNHQTLPADNPPALLTFQRKVSELQRSVYGANKALQDAKQKMEIIKNTLMASAGNNALIEKARAIELSLVEIDMLMNGDKAKSSRNANQPPPISERFDNMLWSMWYNLSEPTKTNMDVYELLNSEFSTAVNRLRNVVEVQIAGLEKDMETNKVPWTPGRIPNRE